MLRRTLAARITAIAFALVLAPALAPGAASAQSATRASSGCTYDTCALRVEPRFWTPNVLVRGHDGVVIGRLGAFGGGVDSLLAGPDSAAAYARQYVTAARTSNTLALLGGVAYVALLMHSDNLSNDLDGTDYALGLSGLGLVIAAVPFELRAGRSLARAIWFYNVALAR
jgi:hypothetical protein